MIIAIDFDGTCVTHAYPAIGKDIGSVPVIKAIADAGHEIILWTMRSGDKLDEAVEWFKQHNIPLYGVNRNPKQELWTASPKAYAQLYIDDAALGCPVTYDVLLSDRLFVDWKAVKKILINKNII